MKKDPIMRECKKHGVVKHIYENGGTHIRCTKCRVDAVTRRRRKLKVMALEYKGNKCSLCGYDKCSDALEFHHRDPNAKEFGIGADGFTRSWGKIKVEIDKCDLVCANCHREIHCAGGALVL